MPHLTVYALESDLTGHESALIAELTEAVVATYGEWAREIAVVQMIGLPAQRWGIGGKPAEAPAPRITFGIKDAALRRPDTEQIVAGLTAGVTGAVERVFGERPGITVDFVGLVSAE
jgi:phenylpyruvate tautomerase PptA (4-oxalocrotonate tautomerase family)